MSPPPDSAARDGAPAGSPASRGRVPPPPDVGPRTESVVGPAPTKPPVVAPPDPAALVATPDRTVVTRRPRASHKPSEPHELMPTLRMPPVEARALRRQVSGTPEAEPEVVLGSGEIEVQASVPIAPVEPVVEAPAPETPPPVVDAREQQPTVRVAAIPTECTNVGAGPKPPAKLHRPPLPLPDVLRNGPRPPSRSERVAEPIAVEAPSERAPVIAVPDSIPVIDTASLVLEMAESLTALPPREAAEVAVPVDALDDGAPEPDVAVLPTVAPRAVNPTIPLESIDLETIADDEQPAPRRRGVLGIGLAVAASIAAAVWWLVPPSTDAAQVDAALAPLGDQLAFVATHAPEPEPIAVAPAVAPAPTPMPALDVPAAPPATALLGEAAGDLIANAMLPSPEAAPEPVAEDAVIEDDEAPVAAPAPAAAPQPKAAPHKSKSKSKSKSKPKAKPQPKVAAAAPPPPAKTSAASLDPTALLRDAEKAYAEGRYATALRNAQRSLAGRNDARATRILALSACKLKRESVAKSAFDRLPLGQRRGVKNTCKEAGIKL